MNINIFYCLAILLASFSCVTNKKTAVGKVDLNREPLCEITELNTLDSAAYFTLSGMFSEVKTIQPVIFGCIAILHRGKVIAGTETNFDGQYSIQLALPFPKTLDIEFSYLDLETFRVEEVKAINGKQIKIDVGLYPARNWDFEPIIHRTWPRIRHDDLTSGQIFSSEQIRRSSIRSN